VAVSSPPAPAATAAPSRSAFPWIVAGSGGVALGAGLALGALAQKRHDDAIAEPDAQRASADQGAAEDLVLAANVTLIGGAVLAAAGVTWAVLELRSAPDRGKTGLSFVIAPASAAFRARF
jgi:hypothetical protein